MKAIAGRAVIIGFILLLGFSWFAWNHLADQKNSENPEEVLYEVQQGQGFSAITKDLQKKGLIRNAHFFTLYAKIIGEAGKMKVGEYALRKNMRPTEILALINSGKSIGRKFTVPEGMNIFEISEMYEKEGFGSRLEFYRLCKDKQLIRALLGEERDSLEGYLFPETYSLTKFTDAKTLISTMVKKFATVWKEIEPLSASGHLTKHQIVTLASIVEKETGAPEERPLISSIFHNRLKKGMLLQTDPTVLYGKAEILGKMIINITKADLSKPTRFNTYVIRGLPPGPIANPSKEALVAAMQPSESEYLYFVSQNQGTHIFSKDYQSHLNAVKKYQMDAKAREGKSWRDLKKAYH